MKPTKLTTKQALITSITVALGAVGGSVATNLTDTDLLTAQQIIEVQESKLAEGGEFQQYLKGGVLPEKAEIGEKPVDLPPDTKVDVYDGPSGKGYVIVQELPDRTVYLGYGPEAEALTKIEMKQLKATSSSEIVK